MKVKNKQIYYLSQKIEDSKIETILPAKYGFYVEKNKNLFSNLIKEIENFRIKILAKYGTYNDNSFSFNNEERSQANQELNQLLNCEQDINISYIYLEDLVQDNLELSLNELSAITFMIKEKKEEKV